MEWTKLNDGDGNYEKWYLVGQSLEGVLKGTIENKYGHENGIIETKEGEKEFSLGAVLSKALHDIQEGDKIKIVYQGKKMSARGKSYNNFDVYREKAA